MTLRQIVHLLQYADSALPVGAFAFSNSLETAVEPSVCRSVCGVTPGKLAFVVTFLQILFVP
jgi:hypothetical protein